MMRDHEHIEELISVRALGGLDPEDEAALSVEMTSHGLRCGECRRLEDEYAEVAGRLGFALEPARVRAGLEDETVALATASIVEPMEAARVRRRASAWRALVAVAAAVVLFFGGWLVRDLTIGETATQALRDARVVPFRGTAGHLAVAYRPEGTGLYLFGSDLPPLPSGEVYEVWMIRGGTPVPATCFRPHPNGSFLTFVDAQLGASQAMAVTVEPSACPSKPTTQPVATADLTQV